MNIHCTECGKEMTESWARLSSCCKECLQTAMDNLTEKDIANAVNNLLDEIVKQPKPGERGYQPGCGCCAGPENDRCCCVIHQDIPRGLRAHKCSLHGGSNDG